ncbi:MAG: S46 family peptidase, partial [Bacteroidota bacterium]
MKNVILTISAFLFLFSLQLKADEGMWIISLINKNYDEMKAKGLILSAEDIYDINNACIKDAVIRFGRGCTGEIISNEGLLITNHHCGYSWMQSLSSVDHDYITDGYWAMNKGEEIPTPGLSVTFLVRFEDVTEKVLAELTDEMTEDERSAAVRKISKIIEKESAGDSWYDARVSEFFEGNQYFLCIYETYNDIRFVGAPPATIGDFGGDTDNWMWPRHTGDFSMFRIYMSPDGKPADYSTDNIPFKPKHFLPVSLKGVKENDFTMIIGFPGRTNRYLTSYGIDEAINLTNPA